MKMYKIKKKTTKLDYVLEKIREEFDLSIEKTPYDMMDVYNDMQYCKDLLKDIYDYARIMRQDLV